MAKLQRLCDEFSVLGFPATKVSPNVMACSVGVLEHILWRLGRKRKKVWKEDGTWFWVKAKEGK